MNKITTEALYQEKKDEFSLEIVIGEEFLRQRTITTYDIFRPGLALAGYTGYFLSDRILIVGETETVYLKTLAKKLKDKRIATVMSFDAPCLIVTKGLDIDKKFIEQAKHRKIPILRTSMSTTPFIHKLSAYLDYKLAPTKYVQGTLVDIYGVGVLFIGKPGTGKSECAMDLIERGHRFVADDLVKIVKRGNTLIGSGAEKSDRLRHHIEIRGVGIINIFRIFGVKSVRLRKRIEVVVELILWDETKGEYERIGLEKKVKKILDVKIPRIVIPLTPGKNISVIAEVIAMNYLLGLRGINPAKEYDIELKRVLSEKEMSGVYYDEHIE
ncbi:HPr kinase/phosphorylase [subsurface metagenome]